MPRAVKVLLVLAGVVLVVIVTLVVCFVSWRRSVEKSLKTEIAAIRTNGLPVDMADLKHWPLDIPDQRNAALIFEHAFEMMGSSNSEQISDLKFPVRGGAISNKTELTEVLTKNAGAMALIYGITNPASSRYPIEYLDGPSMKVSHLSELKTMALLFADGALLKSDQKDSHGAFEDVAASCKLSRSLDNEPILISQLVAASIFSITTESLQRVLARVSLSDSDLSQLQENFKEGEATNRFWMALVGERAVDGEMMRLLQDDPRAFIILSNKGVSKEDQTEVPIRNPGVGWRSIGYFQRDREFYLRVMEEYISGLAKTPPESLWLTNKLDALALKAHGGWYLMSSMFLSSFSRVASRDADLRARLRTAMAAVAVERWRIAHNGQIPDSLDELVPAFLASVPQDPFDGHPLRFKKLASGYAVYSVGPDGVDDGGKERPPYSRNTPEEERSKYDILFIVEQQPKN